MVSRNDHSYIHLFPEDTTNANSSKEKGRRRNSMEDYDEDGAEPDTLTDDLVSHIQSLSDIVTITL